MKKMIVLLFCLLLCLTACAPAEPTETNDLPEGVSYAIKVVAEDGTPIVGAMVSLCQDKEGGTCYMPALTGEDGVAYFYEKAVPVQGNMKFRVLAAEGYDLPLDESGDIRYTQIPNGEVYMIQRLEKIPN